jgi:hypothetical protein
MATAERAAQPHPNETLETEMADDTTEVGGQDRKRINLSEDYEVTDWCKSLGVTEEQLRMAVAAVGDEADEVRVHLGRT